MVWNNGSSRKRQRRPRRQFRGGKRVAVVRALAAACSKAGLPIPVRPTLKGYSTAFGTNVTYVNKAAVVLKAEDPVLIDRVMNGAVSLNAAAHQVRARAEAIAAFRKCNKDDLVAVGRAVGVGNIWDMMIVPVL